MLLGYLLKTPLAWAIAIVFQIIAYGGVLRKMGLPVWNCIVPCLAEWRLSTVLFRWKRSFWRPFIVSSVLFLTGLYLNPYSGTVVVKARLLMIGAVTIYSFLLIRLYWRLSRAFGKGWVYALLMTLVPPVFLFALGYGSAKYLGGPEFPPAPKLPILITFLWRAGIVLISGVEILALLIGVGYLTIRSRAPRFFVNMIVSEEYESTKDVTGTGVVVTREDTMGDAYANLASMPTSRAKLFPDHSQDKDVTVMVYCIGSDLEMGMGFCSVNIKQMVDATKQGSALTFVLECGGSERWFTEGIKDGSYGRYIIHDGKLEKVMDLPANTCMSTPEAFESFLAWAKDAYPADRRMLVLWDHGSGFGMGYGYDNLNKRDAENPLLLVSEIVQAIDTAGLTFDVIGFDACLMQNIEVATAFEPYADYFLGSEESEGGPGWFYTSGFGQLAQNPGMSSEDFGREMVACYDAYNRASHSDGAPQPAMTLSFVDLTLAKPAYEQMNGLFEDARVAIASDSTNYASLSLAGTKSYTFQNREQVDLIDFLTHLDAIDYEDKILTDEDRNELITAVRACVLYRNGDSAEGINGMALTFPASSASSYTNDYRQLRAFSYEQEEALYNDFFSIMAAAKQKEYEQAVEEGSFLAALNAALGDITGEEWYVEGFENYETQDALIDIPLTEVENGYQIELPEKAWGIIADSQMIVYQKDEDGLLRYLGIDSIGSTDENGHPLVAMGDTWVHVGGQLVCYESRNVRETEDGVVFEGTARAQLNGKQKVIVHIEWDPVTGDDAALSSGRITGYELAMEDNPLWQLISEDLMDENLASIIDARRYKTFEPGDRIAFLFDCYDEAGSLVKTEVGGTVLVTSMERLKAEDKPLGECDIVFGGVLTDVYQRTMTTEKIEAHIS